MFPQEKLDRINELAHKKKNEGLTNTFAILTLSYTNKV